MHLVDMSISHLHMYTRPLSRAAAHTASVWMGQSPRAHREQTCSSLGGWGGVGVGCLGLPLGRKY